MSGANDGKKGTQQRSIKVSGRHRQTTENTTTLSPARKEMALIPQREAEHSAKGGSTVILC